MLRANSTVQCIINFYLFLRCQNSQDEFTPIYERSEPSSKEKITLKEESKKSDDIPQEQRRWDIFYSTQQRPANTEQATIEKLALDELR